MIKRKHLTNHNLHLQCAIVHASRFDKNMEWEETRDRDRELVVLFEMYLLIFNSIWKDLQRKFHEVLFT